MNIQIHDTVLEARIQKQIQATGATSAEEACFTFSTRRKDRIAGWLENKEAINVKIMRSIDQLDRGEGLPEDQLESLRDKT